MCTEPKHRINQCNLSYLQHEGLSSWLLLRSCLTVWRIACAWNTAASGRPGRSLRPSVPPPPIFAFLLSPGCLISLHFPSYFPLPSSLTMKRSVPCGAISISGSTTRSGYHQTTRKGIDGLLRTSKLISIVDHGRCTASCVWRC